MVNPGILPLSLVRGSAFTPVILECKDEKVTVTGTLSPNTAGLYTANGSFNDYPLFVLSGAPSSFIYFSTPDSSYVISRTLTTAALTDYWLPAAPLTEPTGTYLAQGAVTGTATVTDNPTDLTGFTAKAQVRRTPQGELYIDLNPSVTDAVNGQITLPGLTTDETMDLEFPGDFQWDLILVDGAGEWYGPFVKGSFKVLDKNTQNASSTP